MSVEGLFVHGGDLWRLNTPLSCLQPPQQGKTHLYTAIKTIRPAISVVQNRETSSAIGKLNGQVAPISNAASRRIQRLSLVKNQLINAQIQPITA
ncbi:hypothetical protein ACUXKK_004557 [Klebsiella aerogenes]